MKMKHEIRVCNICGMPEPTKDKPQPDECGGHWHIHPSYWNLAENNTKWSMHSPIPLYPVTYKQFKKSADKRYVRSTYSEK